MRPTYADVDLGAVVRNVATLARTAAPAALCVVVKADGYGHGAVAVAAAARRGGAPWLAVALVEEGVALRDAGIAGPILLLSEPRPAEMADARAAGLVPTLYTAEGVAAAADAGAGAAGAGPWEVHLKVDTGMHRVGAPVEEVLGLAERIRANPTLRLTALWTHCAVADDPADPFTAVQLDRFEHVHAQLVAAGHSDLLRHAGNSAVAIAHPRGRYEMVRCGIAVYGVSPSPELAPLVELEPAMSLRSEVTHVQTIAPGEGVSYGRCWRASGPTRVATVPIGYADGVRRELPAAGGEVLLHGHRRPMVGVVTMDHLMVDCGDLPVQVGDEVVLIGRQGSQAITAEEVASRLRTIGYEVVCDVGARVRRRVVQPR